ncbi:glycoside hydrolase family 18 protein, partial [Pseudoxanthomonas sp. SGD-10]
MRTYFCVSVLNKTYMKRILNIGLALVIAVLSSCEKDFNSVPDGYMLGEQKKKPEGAYVSDTNFKIVAYYSESREIDSIAEIKFKQITHLHYAFAYPTAEGGIKAIARPANFARIKELSKQHGFKLAVTIAAVSAEDGKVFAKLVTDPTLRKTFINNIVNFAVLNDLDGIDIDWEYPNFNSAQNITYEAFMKELSAELHSWHKYLSAAVTAGVYAGGVRDGIT